MTRMTDEEIKAAREVCIVPSDHVENSRERSLSRMLSQSLSEVEHQRLDIAQMQESIHVLVDTGTAEIAAARADMATVMTAIGEVADAVEKANASAIAACRAAGFEVTAPGALAEDWVRIRAAILAMAGRSAT